MFKVVILLGCALVASAQYYPQDLGVGVPNPYQYSYENPAIGGSSSAQESGDGNGRVSGSYTVTDDDGRTRTVNYVADEGGFRANVITNEPGTSNQAPADVVMNSSADDGLRTYASGPSPAYY